MEDSKEQLKKIVKKGIKAIDPAKADQIELKDSISQVKNSPEVQKGAQASDFISGFLRSIKGDKGDKGDLPVYKKDYLTEEEIAKIKEELRPAKGTDYLTADEVQSILDIVTPVKGRDYQDGIDGKDALDGEKGDKGDPGRDGKDGRDGIDGINADPKIVIEELRNLKGNDRLDISHLRNGEQLTAAIGKINGFKFNGTSYKFEELMHGGGGSSGGSQTLAQTLALGNTTGGHDISVTAGDVIVGAGSGAQIDLESNAFTVTTDNGAFLTPYLFANQSDINLSGLGSGAIDLSLGGITITHGTKLNFDAPVYNFNGLSASELTATDASKNLVSLSTATYPSLTELSYVKGVTSSIQTQLNSKGSGTVTSVSGTANRVTSTGGATPVIDIAATYVGQSSITTLGTITTGVWHGSTIDSLYLTNTAVANLSGTNTGDQNLFSNIPVSGQTTVTANSATTALTLVAGSGMTITTDNTAKTITFAATSGGGGTVTTLSVVSANGFAGTVANPTTAPAITLTTSITGVLKGNGTAISAATAGSDYAVGSLGLSGGQTIAGSTLTAENLTLRANAADLTTGQVNITSTKEATNTTTASVAISGGLAVAKRVFALDMTVTNAITGAVTGNAGTATALLNARTIGGVSFNGTADITVATATGGFTVSGGNLAVDARNISTDTTTGTKFGTATNQKIGFYNATPIVQPTGDVITALQNLGLGATLTVAATTITSRTLWGQTYDGSANVSGSQTGIGDMTGGASSMIITAGTGNSRTLTLRSTTSGGVATAFLTGNADQSSTFGGNISGTGAWTITGGAGNMTIVSGTGASRTMILQTTTAGSTATTALTLNADQTATFAAGVTVGGTLAVGANSLTMTGSLAATGARVTKGWFTDLESTNMPTVGGTAILTSLTAPQFTTIELGAASDTTLARVSAGVISVEGVRVITSGGTTSGTILKNNGTTFVASTETYAVPGSSGNVMTSDGTNWTSAAPSGGGITWTVITADQTAAVNNGYICNKGTLLTITLPTTAAAGTVIYVAGMNAGLWKIAQNASQQIHFGNQNTTSGTGGSLASVLTYDSVQIVCSVANLEWVVIDNIGNITVA